MANIKVFISHSSKDRDLATKLIDLLEHSFKFPNDSIRCTSVPGYELPGGTPTVSILRKEIRQASVVIGLLTPNSHAAVWPVCEMGAAWALGKYPVPLLAGGISHQDVAGPLGEVKVLNAASRDDVVNLLDILSNRTNLPYHHPDTSANALGQFLQYVQEIPPSTFFPSQQLLPRSEIFQPVHRLRWSDIAQDCTAELYVWGWSCINTIGAPSRDAFSHLVENGASLKFLILDPEAMGDAATAIDFGHVCNTTSKQVVEDIERGREKLIDFRTKLPGHAQERVKLKKTIWPMTWSGVAIDPQTNAGRLQIEFYHYADPHGRAGHLDARPNLVLTRSSPFYTGFWKSFDAMWKEAKPF